MSPLKFVCIHKTSELKHDDPVPLPFDLVVRLQSVTVKEWRSGVGNEHSDRCQCPGQDAAESADASRSRTCDQGLVLAPDRHRPRKYLGLMLTLTASLCLSFSIVFAKLLQPFGYHGNCTSFWRYIGVTGPTISILLIAEYGRYCNCTRSANSKSKSTSGRQSIFSSIWPVHEDGKWKTGLGLLLRGFLASSAVVLRYYALEYLPIGDTVVIAYSTPILVTVFAHFILGEKAGVIPFGVAFTTLIGVAIVAKPPLVTGTESFTTETMIGTSLAVGSLLCSALQLILTRKIRSVHFTLVTVSGGLIGLGLSEGLALYFQDFRYPTGLVDGLYVVGLAATSFLGQIALVLALKWEKAGPVALLRSSDILFGFLFQYFFMNVVPEWTSLAGAALIVAGVLVTAVRKWCQDLPDDDHRKNSLRFLLA